MHAGEGSVAGEDGTSGDHRGREGIQVRPVLLHDLDPELCRPRSVTVVGLPERSIAEGIRDPQWDACWLALALVCATPVIAAAMDEWEQNLTEFPTR